ncbi:MAG: hypothetical protein CL846_00095 [Crocinitomicaceae bacterium]|nr:hypothetical protein [Crocinitomicaceae bacterium]|tara:strand:- start:3516 stop:3947 length:432 start_codon:yes stop_codon:yes gene_type:complete
MEHTKIKLKEGLSNIKFLSSIEDVISILGEPTEDESINDIDDSHHSRLLHYDHLGLSASFDEEENWKLTSIAISEEEYTINGINLIGSSKSDFLKKIQSLNLGECQEEIFNEEDYESTVMNFDEKHITFWFENDELQEIQWSY